jgi:hypothetical protein
VTSKNQYITDIMISYTYAPHDKSPL